MPIEELKLQIEDSIRFTLDELLELRRFLVLFELILLVKFEFLTWLNLSFMLSIILLLNHVLYQFNAFYVY